MGEIWRSLEMVEFFDLDVVIECHPAARKRDHRSQSGLLPGAAQGGLDGGGFSPRPPARAPAAQAALSDAGPARGAARFRVEPGGATAGIQALLAGGGVKISSERLRRKADATEFRPEVLEKDIHLLNLLEALRSHPFLKDRLVPGAGRHPPYSTAPNTDEAMTRLLSPDSDIHPLFALRLEPAH